MESELNDSLILFKAIDHFLSMNKEYAREYLARLPHESAELLVRTLESLGQWLPEEVALLGDNLVAWLFPDDVNRVDFESGKEADRPEAPRKRLSEVIERLSSMATTESPASDGNQRQAPDGESILTCESTGFDSSKKRKGRRDPEFVEERLQNLKRTWVQDTESLATGWKAVNSCSWAGHRRISADTYLRFQLITFRTSSRSSATDATIAAWHPTILEYLNELGIDPSPVDVLYRRFIEGDLTDKLAVRREATGAFSQLDHAIEIVKKQYLDGDTEIHRSGKVAFVEEAVVPVPEAEPEFVFRRHGDGYFIRGFGEEGHFSAKGAKGLHDLYRVVQSPGLGVPLREIDAWGDEKPDLRESRSRQPVADGGTLQEIAAKRLQLKADIEAAESNLERSELQPQLDELETLAKALTGRGGRSRDLNNPLDRLRPKVWSRVKTAIERIRSSMPTLAKHFNVAVRTEAGGLLYSPGSPDFRWEA